MWDFGNLLSFFETKTLKIGEMIDMSGNTSVCIYVIKNREIDECKLKWTTKFIKAIVCQIELSNDAERE